MQVITSLDQEKMFVDCRIEFRETALGGAVLFGNIRASKPMSATDIGLKTSDSHQLPILQERRRLSEL